MTQTDKSTSDRPLRLWPGVLFVVLQWLIWLVVPIFAPEASMFTVLGAAVGGLLVLLWWTFFSRARWSERVGAIALMVLGLFVTSRIVHESVANGMMGMMLLMYSIPVLSLALVAWAAATRRLSTSLRRVSLVVTILLACGAMAVFRTGGVTGNADSDLHWRWTKTPEEQLLAQAGGESAASHMARPASNTNSAATLASTSDSQPSAKQVEEPLPTVSDLAETNTAAEWPGFRGPERDSIIRGTRIASDWSRAAPVELWRRPIGPAWSSFAVQGNLVYTQEQRGEDEIVSCYELATGAPVWMHRDVARFWESNAGAGPRGTPTLSNGRVYTFGGTGILNALDARDGSVLWSRNAASDTGKKTPNWGFAASPLIFEDLVIIATAGVLAAYDIRTGNPRWLGTNGGAGYSSPHLATVHGVAQVVLINGPGVMSVAPRDGQPLWDHSWPGDGIVQPRVIDGTDLLVGSGSGLAKAVGLRRLAITHGADGWTVQERWTSTRLKPYFNDFVVHQGHAYGFDGSILACLNLADGQRKWKGGRYGHGQLILLRDQDLLLVLSEKGELAMVKATTEDYAETARFAAIKGKTWNHPVLVRDILLVRNAEEMAAFRLPLAGADAGQAAFRHRDH